MTQPPLTTQTESSQSVHSELPLPEVPATAMVALTTIIVAHSNLIGFIAIIAFYLLWLPQIFLRPRLILNKPGISLFILLPSLICTYSFFWSQVPQRSLYFGLQFVSMVICSIIIARCCSINSLVRGLVIGSALILVASISSGHYHQDYFTGELSLFGYFGSKNQVGLYADISILSSLLILFNGTKPEKFFLALPAIAISCIALVLCRSAGSLAALLLTIAAFTALFAFTKLKSPLRQITFAFMLLSIIIATIFIHVHSVDLSGAALNSMGKDSTLTGRTYLWGEGIKAALQRPILGYGYSAFWAPGMPLAERYWAEFGIPDRTGFHFHNLLIQTQVDIGIFGLISIIGILIGNLFGAIRHCLRNGLTYVGGYTFIVATLFGIRCFVEVDFLGQYNTGTLMVFSVLPILSVYASRLKDTPSA